MASPLVFNALLIVLELLLLVIPVAYERWTPACGVYGDTVHSSEGHSVEDAAARDGRRRLAGGRGMDETEP